MALYRGIAIIIFERAWKQSLETRIKRAENFACIRKKYFIFLMNWILPLQKNYDYRMDKVYSRWMKLFCCKHPTKQYIMLSYYILFILYNIPWSCVSFFNSRKGGPIFFKKTEVPFFSQKKDAPFFEEKDKVI